MGGLEALYNYTVFHIGLYFTVAGGVVAFLNLDMFSKGIGIWTKAGLLASIFLLVIAGAFGSLVASSITRTEVSLDEFLASDIGPIWKQEVISTELAIGIEHGFFWLAISILFITVATAKKEAK